MNADIRPLPCGREKCIGKACGNWNGPADRFGDPKGEGGCKGGDFPPWSWAKLYITELPKYHAAKYAKRDGAVK